MLKRSLDLIVAISGLVILSLPLLVLYLLVRVKLGAPVFFHQSRPGLNGQPFKLIKFRTMKDLTDGHGTLLPDAERLTPLGKLLRESSLDELPSLWNVLKGEMSLVGPRPLLMEYLPLYSKEQARRHEVKPGITGWAQINGRNAISWQDKFTLDVWYVDHQSLSLDIKILLLTIKKVFTKADINAQGQATMSKFTGDHHE